MAPMNPDIALGWLGAGLLSLAIGFLFGFVLEQAGFGNSRKLAAQFYLRDMTVLKVMFTAIVTAMLLLSIGAGLGMVDMSRIWVNPTYLWPGIAGGFLLGLGFIIGGYCPGTSLVSMVTLKIDGLLFFLGCLTGIFVFGEAVDLVPAFYHHVGDYGRVTLYGWLGIPAGWMVFGVAVMAVGVFAMVEQVERMFGATKPPRRRGLVAGASLVGTAAVAALVLGQPTTEQKVAMMGPELDRELAGRQFHVDPGELLGLMNDRGIRLALLDVRSEGDYNLFHLKDARHVTADDLAAGSVDKLPAEAVKIVMSNDEAAADAAWKVLRTRGVLNVYVLAGGINGWLDAYGEGSIHLAAADGGNDRLRHRFPAAAGAHHPVADPDPHHAPPRQFKRKVKIQCAVRLTGGCGG